MLSSLSQAKKKKKKKIHPISNNSLSMVAEIPTEMSLPLSLLAVNIWFPAMIHFMEEGPQRFLLLFFLRRGRGMGIGFCGKGEKKKKKKLSGVKASWKVMVQARSRICLDMFRWWRWWFGERGGGGGEGSHICERGCLSPGASPRERESWRQEDEVCKTSNSRKLWWLYFFSTLKLNIWKLLVLNFSL